MAKPKTKTVKKRTGTNTLAKDRSMDTAFLLIVLVLLAFGLIMVFSASYAYALNYEGDSFYYIKRQGIFAVLGVIGMLVISRIDYRLLKKFWVLIYAIGIVLLVCVFVPGLSVSTDTGVSRWIGIGSLTYQPSEFAKLAIIVSFSALIYKNYPKIKTFRYGIIPFAILLVPVVVLVYLEPHLSGLIIIVCIAAIMMFVGGVRLRHMLAVVLAGVILLGSFLLIQSAMGGGEEETTGQAVTTVQAEETVSTAEDGTTSETADSGATSQSETTEESSSGGGFFESYQWRRIQNWLDPFGRSDGSGYDTDITGDVWQTCQSLLAIGSGGIMGLGLGNSRQKYMYLPEPQNDFIFAIVCEELGLIGAILVILLFVLLVYRGFVIANRAPNKFASMLVVGITVQIGIQALFNIAVVTNAFPNTGISLPFFSYGGTALMMQLFEMGVVLNISRHTHVAKERQDREKKQKHQQLAAEGAGITAIQEQH